MKIGEKVYFEKYYKKTWRPFPYEEKELLKIIKDNCVCKFTDFKEKYIEKIYSEKLFEPIDDDDFKFIYQYEGYKEKWLRVCATNKMFCDGEYEYQRFKSIECKLTGIVCGQRVLKTKGNFSISYHYDGSEFLDHSYETEKFYIVAVNLNRMVLVKASEITKLEAI